MQPGDRKFQRYVLNESLSLVKLLESLDIYIAVQGTCFCPFHDDTGHRSGKVYRDERGESLFCFAEHKQFKAADVIEVLMGTPIEEAFQKVWVQLSPERQQAMEKRFQGVRSYVPESWLKHKEGLKYRWQQGKISYADLVTRMMRYMNEPEGKDE